MVSLRSSLAESCALVASFNEVREAKVMLHHTQMPVAEVAETLGFATPSFFIRFFRQQTGQTPLQYRKQG